MFLRQNSLSNKKRFTIVCFIVIVASIIFSLLYPQLAHACTGFYAGRDVTEDGTTYLGRSNDSKGVAPNYVKVYERIENVAGRYMPIDVDGTCLVEITPTTYKYTATPYCDSTQADEECEIDAATCSNELGVSCTATVTAFANSKILELDPLVDEGIAEDNMSNFLICQSASAREAVDLLFSTIDKYGSGENNSLLIADNNETWYVELYSGHSYAAVKLPTDGIAVYGNEFMLEYVSDYPDYIVSNNLNELANKAGTAVYGKNNELNILKSYSAASTDYSHLRTWMGHKLFAANSCGEYSTDVQLPFIFKPEQKVKLTDVFNLYRNRYDGLEYSPENGRNNTRVIGSETQRSVHVNQIYSNLPQKMSVVTWECLAPAIGGIFVPVSNMTGEVTSAYGLNQDALEAGNFDSDTYPWFAFKEITTVGTDQYSAYLGPVQKYWQSTEEKLVCAMSQAIKIASDNYNDSNTMAVENYFNEYQKDIQNHAFDDAKYILNELRWNASSNSNSFKVGRNPETHEITDKVVEVEPVEINLDNSEYADVPAFEQTNFVMPVIIVLLAAVIVIGLVIYIGRNSNKEQARK